MALTFDATYYYQQRSDVLDAYLNSDMSLTPYQFALSHYNLHGWREGANPHPVFDTKEYLDANSDVKDAGVNPFDHFNNHGLAEGRAPSSKVPGFNEFDWETYVNANSDLQTAGINTAEAAYNHYINHGYAENRPGAPNHPDISLDKAIAALQAAQEAADDFWTENAPAATIADLEANVDAAEVALAADIVAAGSDAKLQSDLSAAQKDINAVPGLAAAIRSHEARKAALDAAKKADDLADADLAAAEAKYTALNSALTFTLTYDADGNPTGGNVSDTGGTIIVVASGKLVLNAGVDEATNPGVTGLLSALDAAVKTEIALIAATSAEADAAADVGTLDPGGLAAALDAAKTALETRAELVKDIEDAKAVLAEGTKIVDALEAAEKAGEDLGVDNIEIVDAASEVGTDGSDVFILTDDDTTLSQSIFGFEADDALFIGTGYNLNKLAATDNINGDADFGNISALDIFIQQNGADTVIYVEKNTYDGQANGAFVGESVTLVGVDASSIVYENGFIRIADAVA